MTEQDMPDVIDDAALERWDAQQMTIDEIVTLREREAEAAYGLHIAAQEITALKEYIRATLRAYNALSADEHDVMDDLHVAIFREAEVFADLHEALDALDVDADVDGDHKG